MKKLIPIAVAATLLLAGCGSGNYAATEIPAKPAPAKASTAPSTTAACDEKGALASYAPEATLPPPGGPMPTGMAKIVARGRLIAGVSADSLHLGARNPISGKIEGFDIDMVQAVADAIFGKRAAGQPPNLELRVISSPQRIPSLQNGSVDIVARNMTINCTRWKQIAFSAEYYRSGQKTLVQRDSTATKIEDLKGKTVCAPAGSTSLDNMMKRNPEIKPVTADSDTGCLVLFQQGKADAISGDDTVLAGDAAQDPYAKVLPQRFSDEPYGLGINKDNVDFVRFVNGVLDQMKASPEWMKSYTRWLEPDLGKLSSPPPSVYGRVPGQ